MQHATPRSSTVVDASGASLFHHGAIGEAHVRAHRALDAGRLQFGHAALSEFLQDRTGHGSDWAHVQWHQLVFELALGQVEQAVARYHEHVAPAVRAGVAATDGPSALWRISLVAPSMSLPWSDVHTVAVRRIATTQDTPFVTLHHLLALAGAGDQNQLLAFAHLTDDDALRHCARALAAWAQGDVDAVVYWLDALTPTQMAHIGGSHAQNELLVGIRAHAAAIADHSLAA